MKITHADGTVTEAIGYVNLGTHIAPRAKLAMILPDLGRFERWLSVAQRIDRFMTAHDGAIPSEFKVMSIADRRAVAATLSELGELQRQAGEECRAELARRDRMAHG